MVLHDGTEALIWISLVKLVSSFEAVLNLFWGRWTRSKHNDIFSPCNINIGNWENTPMLEQKGLRLITVHIQYMYTATVLIQKQHICICCMIWLTFRKLLLSCSRHGAALAFTCLCPPSECGKSNIHPHLAQFQSPLTPEGHTWIFAC